MYEILRSPFPRRSVLAPLSAVVLCLLLFLAACGSAPSTTGSAPASGPTATTPPDSTNDTGGNYGKGGYGGGNTTPTPTTAVTGPSKEVTISGLPGSFAFAPDTLTIAVGTTVIWTNSTKTPHTVTSDDGKTFNSGDSTPVESGAAFHFTFTKPGVYKYHCDFHPSMMATIIVQ